MKRYAGGVEELCELNVSKLVAWIEGIPKEAWPNWVKYPEHKGHERPSVNADLNWQGMEVKTDPVVRHLIWRFPNCYPGFRAITVVLPGDYVPPHTDMQPPEWVTRIHVPIITNPAATFMIRDDPYQMKVGKAYMVNTEVPHAIRNDGDSMRVHLMFDIMARFSWETKML